MFPESFSNYPAVYHIKNRVLLIGACIFLLISTFFELRGESRSLFRCFTGVSLFVWTYILLIALRRRLAISQEGLEYDSEFTTLRVRWSEVKAIVKRRTINTLWWTTEALVIRTDVPDSKEYFIDLRQFGRRWRHEPLGAVLQMKAPHLFSDI